jgi:hypothetical protein
LLQGAFQMPKSLVDQIVTRWCKQMIELCDVCVMEAWKIQVPMDVWDVVVQKILRMFSECWDV